MAKPRPRRRRVAPRRSLAAFVAGLALAALATAPGCGGEAPPERTGGRPPRPLTLALDFAPGAVHAGIYAALAGDEDRRRGIALRVRTPTASTDSLKLLASGRADVSVADIHDLGIARERGDDLVGVGAVVQRPLAAVIARPPVRRPRDLEGRRIGIAGLPSDDAVVRALVEGDGGNPHQVRKTTIGFSAVPALVSERVAAVTAFWNAEGVALRRRRVPTREFRVGERGVARYPELVLVVPRETLARDRPGVEAVVAAVRAGTQSALRDPDLALAAISRASASRPADTRAQFRAVRPALSPPVRFDARALDAWATFARRYGIVRARPDVRRAFDLGMGGSP
jgi:putative hydroxymethylpyrimidine transport system substrate-binding protein